MQWNAADLALAVSSVSAALTNPLVVRLLLWATLYSDSYMIVWVSVLLKRRRPVRVNESELVLKCSPAHARLLLPIRTNVGCPPLVVVVIMADPLLMLSLKWLACMTPLAVGLLLQKLIVR